MSTFIAALGAIAGQNLVLATFIIYVGTIFLGNIAAFTGFWIVAHGYFGAWGVPLLVLAMFLANITGDTLWYSLGHKLRNTRLGGWIKSRIPGHERMERILLHNGRKMLFFSKFMYGASFPVVFLIGWTRTPFKKFFRTSVLSILAWIPLFLGLAFTLVSGLSPLLAAATLRDVELIFLVVLAVFVAVDFLIGKVVERFVEPEERPLV